MHNVAVDTDDARLIEENQRLLQFLVSLQRETRHARLLSSARQAECERQRAARAHLERRIAQLSADKAELSRRSAVTDPLLSGLRRIRLIAQRLHASVSRADVLAILDEMLREAGSAYAIFERQRERLALILSSGIDADRYRLVPLGRGRIGRVAASGRPWLSSGDGGAATPRLVACVSLSCGPRPAGALALFHAGPRPAGQSAIDREILGLISVHGAISLHRTSSPSAKAEPFAPRATYLEGRC